MTRQNLSLRLEPLESRHAPATLVSPTTVTYQDADGDAVTVVLSRPVLTPGNVNTVFHFDTGDVSGDNTVKQQLQRIDLTGLPPAPLGVRVTATAANGGNGTADVGWVQADGHDLTAVAVSGDLGRVTAGDPTRPAAGLGALTVGSLGARGLATQELGGSLASIVEGGLTRVTVAGDVNGASLTVNGNIGAVKVGGSLLGGAADGSGSITAQDGNIGPVRIAGGLVGGAGTGSAAITALSSHPTDGTRPVGGHITSVTVGGDLTGGGAASAAVHADVRLGAVHVGSLTGGTGAGSGSISAGTGGIGAVRVDTDVNGWEGDGSASIQSQGGIASVTIGGDVNGWIGTDSAAVVALGGNLGPVRIAGDVNGWIGLRSASVQTYTVQVGPVSVGGRVTSVSIHGNVTGGAGDASGSIHADGRLGTVVLGGDLTGGAGIGSAAVTAGRPGIAAVTVAGNVTGGGGADSGAIETPGPLGPVRVVGNTFEAGDLTGGGGGFSGSIHGGTVASVLIDGTVAGGHGPGGAAIWADHNLGPVHVKGDWVGASIAAGVDPGADGLFDTADDTRVAATIAGITIGGTADGTADTFSATDHFAFVANQIRALSINGHAVPLKPGPANDDVPLGTTGDFRLVELPPSP